MSDVNSGFNVHDMLFLIGLQARTGELVLESGNNIGSIFVHNGTILQAFSPYSRAIGDLLVEEGVIAEAELLEALTLQKKDLTIPLGTLLMKKGKISFEMIEKMVHNQIRTAIDDFRSWENTHFSFIPKQITPFDRIHLPVHEFIRPQFLKTALSFLGESPATAVPRCLPSPRVSTPAPAK
jgi:hypothetical protein